MTLMMQEMDNVNQKCNDILHKIKDDLDVKIHELMNDKDGAAKVNFIYIYHIKIDFIIKY
jgi:hypothetical protein